MIYFIKSPDGPIKIGTTSRLSQRLKRLAAEHGEGLELLGVVDGSFEVERELHSRFSHLRAERIAGREWFEPSEDLIEYINSDGKPWDGRDEAGPATVTVKIDRALAERGKMTAAYLGLNLSNFLSDLLEPVVNEEYLKVIRDIDARVEAAELAEADEE